MKGAGRVTDDAPRVLYLVISGAPAPEGLPSLVTLIQKSGWRVVVFSTPMGTRFADLDELERLTGEPVRWEYRMPGTGERTPPADVVLACPLSFNSVNKFAHGHADNFAVGLLCEMAGYQVPLVVVPHCKPQLPAWWARETKASMAASPRYGYTLTVSASSGAPGPRNASE
jgi:phosphopantothenoylcysteine synthetase/decarboxylase